MISTQANVSVRELQRSFTEKLGNCREVSLWIEVGGRIEWDGTHFSKRGHAVLLVSGNQLAAVIDGAELPDDWYCTLTSVLPGIRGFCFNHGVAATGLLEGHAHLFLDPGGERSETNETELRERARQNAERALRHGVMWLRDCGDPGGINLWVRESLRRGLEPAPMIRACGAAIHRHKRYGKQLGLAVRDETELMAAALDRISCGADDIKLILSGIVNFERAEVPGEPQFSESAVCDVVKLARDHGCRVIVHASGPAATAVAARAGVDTIEHAYFVTDDTLEVMAANRVVWLPTLSPVHVQWRDAQRYGHSENTRECLRRILDGHAERIVRASQMGVNIAGGSDSGSPGVGHGGGAVMEFKLLAEAGLGCEQAYRACGGPAAESIGFKTVACGIQPGAPADFLILDVSPLDNPAAFDLPRAVVRQGKLLACCPASSRSAI